MAALWIVPAILIVLVLGIAFICFYMAFNSKREKIREEYPIPPGKVYEPYREQMKSWMKEMRELPHDDVYIRSFDGLTLHGRYYEHTPGALTELMLHGYRGNAERDLCGGFRLEETSPLEAAKRCRLPVIFIHGEGDDFVPCDMSREKYNAKAEPKALVTVPGAGHGLCCLVDPEGYLEALKQSIFLTRKIYHKPNKSAIKEDPVCSADRVLIRSVYSLGA